MIRLVIQQKYLEEILVEWFNNISKKYKIRDFIFSGGVAQNVKATKILESKNINSIYVPPGPGDESCVLVRFILILQHMKIKKKFKNN